MEKSTKNILLSICVPTYNGDIKLFYSLRNILVAANFCSSNVEVIVSDNASTDETPNIISILKVQYPVLLKNYRKSNNVGFNHNLFSLIDDYANGEFIWIIGDDDFLDSNAVKEVIQVIERNPQIEYIGLNFRLSHLDEIINFKKNKATKENMILTDVAHAIDTQARPENMLSTFVSCGIVRRERLANYDKSIFSADSWDNFQSTFPHSYMLADSVDPKGLAAYISSPLMSVLIRQKPWDNKLDELKLRRIVQLYNHFIKCGYLSMKNSHLVIARAGLPLLYKKRIDRQLRKYFWKFIRWTPELFLALMAITSERIRKLTRNVNPFYKAT